MSDVLSITRGADFGAAVDFDNADGSPINLTGYDVTAVIAWLGGSLALTVAVTDAAEGKAALSLTETQTLLVPQGRVSTLTITYTSAGGDTRLDRCPVEGV
jgi:hypothetical protein